MKSLISDKWFYAEIDGDKNNDIISQSNSIHFISKEQKLKSIKVVESIIKERFNNADELNLEMAKFYKRIANYYLCYLKDEKKCNDYLNLAFEKYKLINNDFLNKECVFYDYKNEKNTYADKISNSTSFLYPLLSDDNGYDVYDGESNFIYIYNGYFFEVPLDKMKGSIYFLKYIEKNNHQELFKTNENFESLQKFLYRCINKIIQNESNIDHNLINRNKEIIQNINSIKLISLNNKKLNLDNEFIKLLKIKMAVISNDTITAKKFANELNLIKTLNSSFQKLESPKNDVHEGLLKDVFRYYSNNQNVSKAFQILKSIKNPWDKRNLLIDLAYDLQSKGDIITTFQFLDSLLPDINKKPKIAAKFFRVNGNIGGKQLMSATQNIMKDIDDKVKPRAISNLILGIAEKGNYYEAYKLIPQSASHRIELEYFNNILFCEITKSSNDDFNLWDSYDRKYYGLQISENYEIEVEHFNRFAE